MTAKKSPTIIERAKKLKALASSPEPHEAEVATRRLDEFMRKHYLVEDDLVDEVHEVVDGRCDEYRRLLAGVVARLHRVRCAVSKNNGIAFRGGPRQVGRAGALYQSVMREFESAKMPPIATWLQGQSFHIWKFFWWEGFTQALRERVEIPPPVEPVKKVRVAEAEQESETVPESEPDLFVEDEEDDVTLMRDAAAECRRSFNVDWLRREALQAGMAIGQRISLRLGEDEFALPANGS